MTTHTLTLRVDDAHPATHRILRAVKRLHDDPRWELRESSTKATTRRRVRQLHLLATMNPGYAMTEDQFRAVVEEAIREGRDGDDGDDD